LSGGLTVLGVRHGTQYDATNRLTLLPAAVRRLNGMRVCREQRALSGGQARSERAPGPHITCCVVACCVLEREWQDRSLTIDKLKRQLSYHGRTRTLPALERLQLAA
jgi:hypothetical protein